MTAKNTTAARRLTTAMREAYVATAMEDVPKTDYEQRLRDEVARELPKLLPPEVNALLANPALEGYVNTEYVSINSSDGLPKGCTVSLVVPSNGVNAEANVLKVGRELIDAWAQQATTRRELRQRLTSIAGSCRTVAELEAALPEFARYIPRDPLQVVATNLPALTGTLDAFAAAGWRPRRAADTNPDPQG